MQMSYMRLGQPVKGVGQWGAILDGLGTFFESGFGSAVLNIGSQVAVAEIKTAIGPTPTTGKQQPAPVYTTSSGQPVYITPSQPQPTYVPQSLQPGVNNPIPSASQNPALTGVSQASLISGVDNSALALGVAGFVLLYVLLK